MQIGAIQIHLNIPQPTLLGTGCSLLQLLLPIRVLRSVLVDSAKLSETVGTDKEVDGRERVVHRDDNE